MFIKHDVTDEMFFDDYVNASKNMLDKLNKAKDKNYHANDCSLDLFSMFYKAEPKKEEGKIPQGLNLMKQALDQIEACSEFQSLRLSSRLDSFLAGQATESMMDTLTKYLPNVGSESRENMQECIDGASGYKESKEYEKQLKQVIDIEAKADKVKLDPDNLRGIVRNALKSAQSEQDSTQDAFYALGQGIDPMNPKSSNLHEKMHLAKKLKSNIKLQNIMKIAGQMTRIAKKVNASKNSPIEYGDVELGDSLNRILASEAMKLAHPKLKGLFYKGLADKALLQYKLDGKEPKGKGPIIVCIDSSGSMAGEREIASKGIALAMLEIARIEKRAFSLIQFASRGQYTKFDASNKVNTLDLLSELEVFLNGGTDFETPLNLAMHEINTCAFDQADIIFITDGCASVSEGFLNFFLAQKKERSTSILGIAIETNDVSIMQSFCDEIFKTEDILRECPTDRIFSI